VRLIGVLQQGAEHISFVIYSSRHDDWAIRLLLVRTFTFHFISLSYLNE
jgi:hypothetical protein